MESDFWGLPPLPNNHIYVLSMDTEAGHALVDEMVQEEDFAECSDAKLDALEELRRIPAPVLTAGYKRSIGLPLLDSERQRLSRYRRQYVAEYLGRA